MKRRKRKRRTAKDVFDINKAADDTIREWLNNGSSSIIPEDPIFPPIKNRVNLFSTVSLRSIVII